MTNDKLIAETTLPLEIVSYMYFTTTKIHDMDLQKKWMVITFWPLTALPASCGYLVVAQSSSNMLIYFPKCCYCILLLVWPYLYMYEECQASTLFVMCYWGANRKVTELLECASKSIFGTETRKSTWLIYLYLACGSSDI